MNAAVFLDRDNTIIHNDGDLGDPSQVRLIQGAASAIASLKGLNYRIIVVTNQGGVARGKYTEADVDRVNEKINELIRANSGVFIDRFYYCPYHPEGTVDRYRRDHPWRKPRPGMLLQAARDLGLDLRQSWMIGDQMRDVQAGFSAGVVPILLSTGNTMPLPTSALPPGVLLPPEDRAAISKMVAIEPSRDFFVVKSLIEAVRLVGQKSRPTNVTAAMKTERIEVVPRPQPRVATASFEVVTTPDPQTSQQDLVAEIESKSNSRDAGNDDPISPDESTLAVVNEVATESAALRVATGAKRRTRADKAARTESETATEQTTAKQPSTQDVVKEIESKAAEPLLERPGTDAKAPTTEPAKVETLKQPVAKPEPITLDKQPDKTATPKVPAKPPRSPRQTTEPEPPTSAKPASDQPASEPEETTSQAISISPTTPVPTAEQSLRQILQELRSQRVVGGEFNYIGVMAIVLQMVAGVCLLAALLMGSGDDGLFLRWFACALMFQLATLAMLLFRKT